MRRFLAVFLGAALLSACSSTPDPVEKPVELQAITPSFAVKRLWQEDTGKGNDGQYITLRPLIAANRLITTDLRGQVAAWSSESGKRLWDQDLDQSISAGVGGGQGLAIVGTREGELIALAADSGEVRWRKKLPGQVLNLSDVDNGIVVARLGGGKVVGVGVNTGAIAWEFVREQPKLTLQGQSKPLAMHGGVALGMDDGSVVMLQMRSGNPIWEATLASGRGRTELERLVDVDGSIAFSGAELFAVAYQGKIAAIDARSGRILWSQEASSSTGVVADSKALYYTDDAGVVHALSRNTGIELWSQEGLKYRRVTRPTLHSGSVVVADYEGYLHWLDKTSGEFVQRKRASSDGILLPPMNLGGSLVTFSDDGKLSLWSEQ